MSGAWLDLIVFPFTILSLLGEKQMFTGHILSRYAVILVHVQLYHSLVSPSNILMVGFLSLEYEEPQRPLLSAGRTVARIPAAS